MRTLSPTLHLARSLIMSGSAWMFFVQIPLKTGGYFRLVRNAKHLRANGVSWQACSLDIVAPAEDAEGSLGQLAIGIPNVSRIPMAYVEADDQVLGQTLTLYLQNESSLSVFEPSLSWRHRVLRARATEKSLSIECGHPAQTQQIPKGVYDRIGFPGLLPSGGVSLAGG